MDFKKEKYKKKIVWLQLQSVSAEPEMEEV